MQIITTIIIISVNETTHHQNSAESVALPTSLLQQNEDLKWNVEEPEE